MSWILSQCLVIVIPLYIQKHCWIFHFYSTPWIASTKCYETYKQCLLPQNSDQIQVKKGSLIWFSSYVPLSHYIQAGASSLSHWHFPHLFYFNLSICYLLSLYLWLNLIVNLTSWGIIDHPYLRVNNDATNTVYIFFT